LAEYNLVVVVKPCKDFGSFVKGTIYVCNQTLCNISEYIKKKPMLCIKAFPCRYFGGKVEGLTSRRNPDRIEFKVPLVGEGLAIP